MWKLIFAILFYCGCVATEKSRVCYYRNKSFKARGAARLVPEDVDPFLCTVINYAFLRINFGTFEVETTMKNDAEIIARLNELKKQNPDLKIVIAVGGWNHEKKPRFSNMVFTKETRKTFIDSVINFLVKHNLDGVSLDWMYPGTRPKSTRSTDKFCFTKLLMEAREAFDKVKMETNGSRSFTLTASVAASRSKIQAGYQIEKMAEYLDRVDVMAHSLWGHWKKTTGSPTAMDGDKKTPTVAKAVMAWINGGMPESKINLVLTSFGRSFSLADPMKNGLRAKVKGPGKAGMYTKSRGVMSYYEICSENWTKKMDWKKSSTLTPYASKDKLWVGYDDPGSVRYKVDEVVKQMNLNGITLWALDWDDFSGKMCNNGKFPLLSEAVDALMPPEPNDCSYNPCKNGGECFSLEDGYACECKPGYTGNICELKDSCATNPCMNNGTCMNTDEGFKCSCKKNYIGERCTRCAKDHTICSMFDDPDYYCSHVWMMVNCAVYCGDCTPSSDDTDMMGAS